MTFTNRNSSTSLRFLHRSQLQQSAEGSAADGTVAGLEAQSIGTHVAEAEVATWQDDSVASLVHADDAFRPVVVLLVVNLVQDIRGQ